MEVGIPRSTADGTLYTLFQKPSLKPFSVFLSFYV